MNFTPFDPLEFKSSRTTDAALGALKKEIENILSSYVGWYDPFCELIQNSLDAVEERENLEKSAGTGSSYSPLIRIIIDLNENSLTVTDNGIGLDKERFEQFLAPSLSFKTGNTRDHKGVGATYVAYGFNYMRVSTRVPGFDASGRIVNARNWLTGGTSGGNPKVEPPPLHSPIRNFRATSAACQLQYVLIQVHTPSDWIGYRPRRPINGQEYSALRPGSGR